MEEKPHVVVLFGATGDLARRKLLPGLFRLHEAGLLRDARIVGTSMEEVDSAHFERLARAACEEFGHGLGQGDDDRWREFGAMLSYVPHAAGPVALADEVRRVEAELPASSPTSAACTT